MKYYAHSGLMADRSDWQELAVHLTAVGNRAATNADHFGMARAARLGGLAHDLGKYRAAFDKRLMGCAARVDHSTAGAHIVSSLGTGDDALMGEILAYCIAGHHAGLPDMGNGPGSLISRLGSFVDDLDKQWKSEIELDASNVFPSIRITDRHSAAFRLAFAGRMIFSAIVDADHGDTEDYYAALKGQRNSREWAKLQDKIPDFVAALDTRLASFPEPTSDINLCRQEILRTVRKNAAMSPGFFSMTVPTGGGKTLSTLAFALDHAARHGHRRIIYGIPFTSIIEQTSDEFSRILGREHILEHHSSFKATSEDDLTTSDKVRLAAEDWSAPIIVTTNVQLLESLFANRPSTCRKLHNIANSVIVLDEAQSIPRHLLVPAMKALDELCMNYGCTVVLCTATQPAVDAKHLGEVSLAGKIIPHPLGVPLSGRELAPDPELTAQRLNLVTLRFAGEMTDDDLVRELATVNHGLVIVNSRDHARALFDRARNAGLDGLYHLSTRQCAKDRNAILAEIRHRLKKGLTCRVISTPLVEAGVDLDFERVWRAEAGLEQIAQAAGRCNRERKRSKEVSVVTVFRHADYLPPSSLDGIIRDMNATRERFSDILSPEAIRYYFTLTYWRVGLDQLDSENILDEFKLDTRGRTRFQYRTAARKFRLIDQNEVPLIIPVDDIARKAIDMLAAGRVKEGVRTLQRYTVTIRSKTLEQMDQDGDVDWVGIDHGDRRFPVLRNMSLYLPQSGLFVGAA